MVVLKGATPGCFTFGEGKEARGGKKAKKEILVWSPAAE
jgi:hypothetical protein